MRRATDRREKLEAIIWRWVGILLILAPWLAIWIIWAVAFPCELNELLCGTQWR